MLGELSAAFFSILALKHHLKNFANDTVLIKTLSSAKELMLCLLSEWELNNKLTSSSYQGH